MTNYPTTLDSFTNPLASQTQAAVSHSGQHANANDSITALEAKVGINGSSVTTSLDYILKNAASIDPGHLHTQNGFSGILPVIKGGSGASTLSGILLGNGSSPFTTVPAPAGTIVGTTDTQTLTNKTITAPTITGTIAGNPTITKPTVNGSVQGLTTDTDAATVILDLSASNIHTITLGGNRTISLANVSVGQSFVIRLIQDGTGSRTVTWFGGVKWPNATVPTLTTTASRIDTFGFLCTANGAYDGGPIFQNLG